MDDDLADLVEALGRSVQPQRRLGVVANRLIRPGPVVIGASVGEEGLGELVVGNHDLGTALVASKRHGQRVPIEALTASRRSTERAGFGEQVPSVVEHEVAGGAPFRSVVSGGRLTVEERAPILGHGGGGAAVARCRNEAGT